jgi:hypothetical protein
MFIVSLCVWHSLVGSFWTKEEAIQLDKWFLIGFSILFSTFHFISGIWIFSAYSKIVDLKLKEKKYLESFKKYKSYRMSFNINQRKNPESNEIKL